MEENPLLEGSVRPTKEGLARKTMNHRVGFILHILNKGQRLGKGKKSDWQTRLSAHSLPSLISLSDLDQGASLAAGGWASPASLGRGISIRYASKADSAGPDSSASHEYTPIEANESSEPASYEAPSKHLRFHHFFEGYSKHRAVQEASKHEGEEAALLAAIVVLRGIGDGIELSLLEALSVAIKAATARLLDGLVHESPATSLLEFFSCLTASTLCLPCFLGDSNPETFYLNSFGIVLFSGADEELHKEVVLKELTMVNLRGGGRDNPSLLGRKGSLMWAHGTRLTSREDVYGGHRFLRTEDTDPYRGFHRMMISMCGGTQRAAPLSISWGPRTEKIEPFRVVVFQSSWRDSQVKLASLHERSGMPLTRISVVTPQRPYVCTIEEYFTVSSAQKGVACGETPMRVR
ncbi:hypothetical protein ACFE04_019726 [Oxalis oulophora]